ncbi:hypothetical protein BDE36_1324 [Arcticibacter tournemirensis]|nr:hypothetical protein BDE36_1324 [Arcticibacter tournemirensis]
MDWTFHFPTGLFFAVDGIDYSCKGREIDEHISLYYLEKSYFEGGSMRGLLSDSLDNVSKDILDNLINAIPDAEIRETARNKFSDRSFFDHSKIPGTGFILNMVPMEKMMHIPQAYFSDDNPDSGLIFSLINSQNIISQHGAFTWNASATMPLEMVAAAEYEKARKQDEPSDFRFCKCINIHKSLVPYILEKINAVGTHTGSVYPTTAKEIDTWEIYEAVKNGIKNP